MAILVNNQSSFFTQEQSEGDNYTLWNFRVHYVWKSGLMQMAIAAEDTQARVDAEIVRESAPVGRMVVDWTAERNGQPPDLPSPESSNTNLTLADVDIRPENPEVAEGGARRIFKVEGKFVYFFTKPMWAWRDGAWMGWCPFDSTSPASNGLPASRFKRIF